MGNSRQGRIPSELGWLIDELDGIQGRLSTLEAPSGEALANTVTRLADTVEQLSALVNNIDATLTEFIENDVQAIVDAAVVTALAGDVTIGGTLNVAGAVTMPGVRATDVSLEYDRIVMWVAGNGKVGHT